MMTEAFSSERKTFPDANLRLAIVKITHSSQEEIIKEKKKMNSSI